MSKERLEEIEKKLDPLGHGMGGHLISVNDIYWLVEYAKEKAERAQELEKQNKRYREALYELKEYLESTIPKIPANEKPLILTKSLEIINRAF